MNKLEVRREIQINKLKKKSKWINPSIFTQLNCSVVFIREHADYLFQLFRFIDFGCTCRMS